MSASATQGSHKQKHLTDSDEEWGWWPPKRSISLLVTCVSAGYHHHNHFMALFPGPPGWASARRELLDFMVEGEINRGRHTPSGLTTAHLHHPPYVSAGYCLQNIHLHLFTVMPAFQPASTAAPAWYWPTNGDWRLGVMHVFTMETFIPGRSSI